MDEGARMSDMHGVDVVCDEGNAFAARHPDLAPGARAMGALTWGLMRAIAECPRCGPGVYRVPVDGKNWEVLACRQCGGVWRWEPPAEDKPPGKRRGKR